MLCESVNSYQKEKEGDLLKGNRIMNLKNLITNIDKFLVCKECAQGRALQIKSQEGKEKENFAAYVEAYFRLTPSDGQKRISELHQDLKNQKSHNQRIYHQYLFRRFTYDHTNGLDSTIEFRCNRGNNRNTSATIILLFIFLSKPNIVLLTPLFRYCYRFLVERTSILNHNTPRTTDKAEAETSSIIASDGQHGGHKITT